MQFLVNTGSFDCDPEEAWLSSCKGFAEASVPDQEAFSLALLVEMPEKHFLELSVAEKIQACKSSISYDGHIPADFLISFLNSKADSGSIGELLEYP